MTSNSKPVWIFVAVVLTLGLMLDAARRYSSGQWRPHVATLGLNGSEDGSESTLAARSPRSASATRARSRLYTATARIAGLDAEKSPQPAVSPAAATSAPSTKPAATVTAAPATKPTTTKAEDRKKKKKKKKKKSTLPGEPASEQNESDADDKQAKQATPSDSGKSTAAENAAAGNVGAPAQPSVDEPKTLDEWLAFILREPNYERTIKLITKHQVHELTADIFYNVVQEMLADSRGKMHEYAVMALGSAPSTRSFQLLQAAVAGEHEGSALRLQARNYIKTYSRIEFLKYLISTITSETSEETRFEALRMIRLSAEQNLKSTRPTTSGSGSGGGSDSGTGTPAGSIGGPPAASRAVSAATTRQFNPLIPILTRLIQTSNDRQVRDEATSTLQRIQSLLGTTVAANN